MRHITILLFVGWVSTAQATGPCEPPTNPPTGLTTKPGFMDFMEAEELSPLKAALPQVANPDVQKALKNPNTMWYDEDSMVFLYQDSIETVVGGRANCVGRKVGERNKDNPAIGKLLNFFGPDYRFRFPFRTAAGTDNVTNKRVINFWLPPRHQGKLLPVRWWRDGTRGRWSWTFPAGTLFGEVLYQKGPNGKWYVFEIRTRERYRDGWAVDVFRPFSSAVQLADGIIRKRPAWAMDPNLRKVVQHLETNSNLKPHQMVSPAFGKVFPPVKGALDVIPEIKDWQLVVELLSSTPFRSTQGEIWKENGSLETYAPSSQGNFGIVPKGYEMGMIPVNEVSCTRCHQETGRRLREFEFDIILYGEVWGEDQIFTWHLFEPHSRIYDTWDDADGSRKLNSRMQQAGLLQKGKPSTTDPLYKPMPSAYVPDRKGAKK